jgi:hypothetical protein
LQDRHLFFLPEQKEGNDNESTAAFHYRAPLDQQMVDTAV